MYSDKTTAALNRPATAGVCHPAYPQLVDGLRGAERALAAALGDFAEVDAILARYGGVNLFLVPAAAAVGAQPGTELRTQVLSLQRALLDGALALNTALDALAAGESEPFDQAL